MKKRQPSTCVIASILPFFVWFFIGNFYGAATESVFVDRDAAWKITSQTLVVESTSVGATCLSTRLGPGFQSFSSDEEVLEEENATASSPIPYSLGLALFLLALFTLAIFIYRKEKSK